VLLAQVRLAWAAGALSESDLQAIDATLSPWTLGQGARAVTMDDNFHRPGP
jgi:hypothetical protein